MSTHDEHVNANDEWTPEERLLLAALPRERIPPNDLKARTAQAVRRFNATEMRSIRSPRRTIAIAGAAAAIFIAGTLVGYVAARRSTQTTNAPSIAKREAVAKAQQETPNINQLRYVVWY